MRIVVDTNELLRMASAWSAPVSPLLEAWRNGRYELALSDPLLAEFIVTNDSDLYDDSLLAARLRDECNLRVVRPAEFLEVIRDH